MESFGRVIKIEGGMALVEVRRASACGESCASCMGGCQSVKASVLAGNGVNALLGDMVKLELPSRVLYRAAFMAYILPIIVMIAVYTAADGALGNDGALALSLAALAATFAAVHLYDKSARRKRTYHSEIVKIIDRRG